MDNISIEEVKTRIESALPGARVQVGTFSGADHFEAVVEASQFEGKSLVEQHKMATYSIGSFDFFFHPTQSCNRRFL